MIVFFSWQNTIRWILGSASVQLVRISVQKCALVMENTKFCLTTNVRWMSSIVNSIEVYIGRFDFWTFSAFSINIKIFTDFVRNQNQSSCRPSRPANCPALCKDEYAPICVRRGSSVQLFSGKCYLNHHNCKFDDSKYPDILRSFFGHPAITPLQVIAWLTALSAIWAV